MNKYTWLFVFLLTVTIINYPNPFNAKAGQTTTFECTTDTAFNSTLYIYDMTARLLFKRDLPMNAGANHFGWNGYTEQNELVNSGVYLYFLTDKNHSRVGKGKVWVINR
ncbi:MAG: T9SS type A sorting domain-containing protein [Candidatus Margulisbacteria bacterium]|nr:T9SS type A sorting domain-containing protein [Candidatus Margulisiibacteriota bacterium]MBU1617705.1 T9SS type A sorting domain-containing protein [Candidatus Margulisiibacteriota bacterium]MBU1867660.1 T9SS type A sorting domain-containing protein [Candidatus Margulisiibacteriota bacterium]